MQIPLVTPGRHHHHHIYLHGRAHASMRTIFFSPFCFNHSERRVPWCYAVREWPADADGRFGRWSSRAQRSGSETVDWAKARRRRLPVDHQNDSSHYFYSIRGHKRQALQLVLRSTGHIVLRLLRSSSDAKMHNNVKLKNSFPCVE